MITEGKIKINLYGKKSVFYNPEAELVRDIDIAALQIFQKMFDGKLHVLDAMAASGVRGIRYAKEVSGLGKITLCDKNPVAAGVIRKNISLNKAAKCRVLKSDASVLMRNEIFSFIDIDPFGSPAQLLDSAARSIYHQGAISVSATDAGALGGIFPEAAFRKYGIKVYRTEFYPEVAVRTLVSYIMLTMSRYDRAFMPLISFVTKHYISIFGRVEHAGKIENLLDSFGYLMYCKKCGNRETGKPMPKCNCSNDFDISGPIYLGSIENREFCDNVLEELYKRSFSKIKEERKLVMLLRDEAELPPFYYSMHDSPAFFGKKLPRYEDIIEVLKGSGFKAGRTHFSPLGIKTNATLEQILQILG